MSLRATLRVLGRGPIIGAPVRAAMPHKPTLFGRLAMERWLSMSWSVDARLKSLAQLRAASMIGCVW